MGQTPVFPRTWERRCVPRKDDATPAFTDALQIFMYWNLCWGASSQSKRFHLGKVTLTCPAAIDMIPSTQEDQCITSCQKYCRSWISLPLVRVWSSQNSPLVTPQDDLLGLSSILRRVVCLSFVISCSFRSAVSSSRRDLWLPVYNNWKVRGGCKTVVVSPG